MKVDYSSVHFSLFENPRNTEAVCYGAI